MGGNSQRVEFTGIGRDDSIVRALAVKVRLLSLEQIAATFWPQAQTADRARRRLTALKRRGLVDRLEVLARPLREVGEPTFSWTPGEESPDERVVARHLRAPPEKPRPTTVYVATKQGRRRFAGKLDLRLDRRHVTHDLHVAAIYLRLLQADPGAAEAWLGEDARGKAGYRVVDPDAVIGPRSHSPPIAIEVATNYDHRRVRRYHDCCEERGMAYQLWS